MKIISLPVLFSLLSITCVAQQISKVEVNFDGVTYTAIAEVTPEGERGPNTTFERIVLTNSRDDSKGIMYSFIGNLHEMWCFEDRIGIIGRAGRYDAAAVFNRITMEPVDHFIASLGVRSPSGRYIAFVQGFRNFSNLPKVNTDAAVIYDLTQTPTLNRVVHDPYPTDFVAGIPFSPKALAETGKFETPNPVDVTDFDLHWDAKEDILVAYTSSFHPEKSSFSWVDFRSSPITVYNKAFDLDGEASQRSLKVARDQGLTGFAVEKVSTPKQEEAILNLRFFGGKLELLLTPETADEVWTVPLP